LPNPDLVAAITAELQPISIGDMAMVELVTLVTYPHRVSLVDVTTLKGKAPISFVEDLDGGACPTPSSTRPGGQGWKQRFRLYYSYDTCQFDHQSVATFRYSTPGQPDALVPFFDNSNNWCQETGVTLGKPVVSSVTPTTVTRGTAFELVIVGTNFQVG